MTTHEVTNQTPPLEGYNVFDADLALVDAVRREGAGWAIERVRALGTLAGSQESIGLGFAADKHVPELRTHDRFGHRIDEVVFHPSWHRLMETATAHELHAFPWRSPGDGAHVARAAMFVVWSQVEAGHLCPISMTHAAIPALRRQPDLAAVWEPRLTAPAYDPVARAPGLKRSALCGMAMTEKQGGSDVRANTTRAEPVESGEAHLLTGHKWFCSAPMSDAFLVLAQAPEGLTCFFMPRMLPDGTRNAIRLQRLKDKLGNRANASAEIELDRAWAQRVGDAGRGVQTIIEMVNFTRLDCIAGSVALMRQALAQATHHAAHRRAFGAALADHALMQNVLADLALESEAATALLIRVARACDRAPADAHEAALKRLGTAIGKFFVCKRAPVMAAEALETLGGNGYVEESIMPRLYREAPLNSIWEGSGNVNALDVLRALAKEPLTLEAYVAELERARGADARVDRAATALLTMVRDPQYAEFRARRIVEMLATVWQAALLVRHAPGHVADAFVVSRIEGDRGAVFGTLPAGVDARALVERATPRIA